MKGDDSSTRWKKMKALLRVTRRKIGYHLDDDDGGMGSHRKSMRRSQKSVAFHDLHGMPSDSDI
jgi:hypothetical protein